MTQHSLIFLLLSGCNTYNLYLASYICLPSVSSTNSQFAEFLPRRSGSFASAYSSTSITIISMKPTEKAALPSWERFSTASGISSCTVT